MKQARINEINFESKGQANPTFSVSVKARRFIRGLLKDGFDCDRKGEDGDRHLKPRGAQTVDNLDRGLNPEMCTQDTIVPYRLALCPGHKGNNPLCEDSSPPREKTPQRFHTQPVTSSKI